MATYFAGSNIQADGMQTLYLMNPDYVGYADMQAPGNMVLVNPSTGIALQNNNSAVGGQPQPHFISVPFHPAQHRQRPPMGVENSNGAHQGIASMSLHSHLGNNSNNSWRNMGNEMASMQTTERPQNRNQTFSGQVNGFSYVGQQCGPEISPTGVKRSPISSMLEQQLRINPNGQGLHSGQAHSSTTHGQVLSLSLSPNQLSGMQFPHFQGQPMVSEVNCPSISQANSEQNINKADRITTKWSGSLSSFRNSPRDSMLGSRNLTNSDPSETNKQIHQGSTAVGAVEISNSLLGSKYFKAAQQLLEEVVNDGKGIKPDKAKHQKSQTWFGTLSDKKNNSTEASTNDGTASAITGPSTSTQEVKNEHVVALTSADRQELQMKKAKLVAMLDEVDRRYKQYYHQLQIVVSTFEAAAGIEAAKTYTAFAISKRFRSLRDAIAGQIQLTSKNLGEDDLTSSGKGETTRLRFVDQQLRQQRALQQLGMIQQHAWRPQRGLPERAVSILRAWLFEHFLHPYPKDADKGLLARQTGLTRSQVSNWFINARVRLWKPMVEEMYLEETREAEAETQKQYPNTIESEKSKEDTNSKGSARKSENEQEQKNAKYMRLNKCTEEHIYAQQTGVSNGGFKSEQASIMNGRNQLIGVDSESDSPVFHEISNNQEIRQGQQKRARSEIQESTAFLPSNMTMDVDLKSAETNSQYILDNKFDSDERHVSEDYNLLNNKIFHHDNNESFGSYQMGGLIKYTQESFAPNFSGISGVSLTLGLQHCDDLSLSRTQQSYSSTLGLDLGRRHHLGSSPDDYSNINQSSADHATSNYDNIAMQNRKRFATHSLHDFVT